MIVSWILIAVCAIVLIPMVIRYERDAEFYKRLYNDMEKTCDDAVKLNNGLLEDIKEYLQEIDDLNELLKKAKYEYDEDEEESADA